MVKPAYLNFDAMGDDETAQFYTDYRTWAAKVKDAFENSPLLKEGESTLAEGLNMGAALRRIPRAERLDLMSEFKHLIKWKPEWDTAAAADKIPVGMMELGARADSKAFRFRLHPSQLRGSGADPRAILYASLFPNVNTSNPAAGLQLGMNLYTPDYLENLTQTMKEGKPIEAGKKIFVFDVETSGLYETNGIRQVAGRTFSMGSPAGYERPGKMVNEYFDTSALHLGALYDPSSHEVLPMSHWIRKNLAAGKEMGPMGYGEDFAKRMRPFLEQIRDSDYIAGHNVNFDIDQIFRGLTATSAYHHNTEGFADLLDSARGRLSRQGSILDTAHMARHMLPELDTHMLLRQQDAFTVHSLENLMLSTNLYEQLKGDMGVGALHEALGIGTGKMMHAAETDVNIEAYLLKYLQQGTLAERSAAGLGELPTHVQRAILKAYAPTPITNISDPSHIDPRLRRQLKPTAIKNARGEIVGYNYGITPVEQEIWATRKLGAFPEIDDESGMRLMEGLGDWHRFTQNWLTKHEGTLAVAGIAPTEKEYFELQERLGKKGIPFAGLSKPERWITTSLAEAGAMDTHITDLMGIRGEMMGEIGTSLGLPRMRLMEDAYVSKSVGGNISLPAQLIQQAEKEGILNSNLRGAADKDFEMLGISSFRTNNGAARVHAVYNFQDEAQATSFSKWLQRNLDDHGMDTAFIEGEGGKMFSFRDLGFSISEDNVHSLSSIIANIPKAGLQHGVGIGYLEGQGAERFHEIFNQLHGGQIRDSNALGLRAAAVSTDSGILKMGALIDTKVPDANRVVNYGKEVKYAVSREAKLGELLDNSMSANFARLMYNAPEGTHKVAERIYQGFEKMREFRAPIAGATAVAAGIWMWHKHKQKTEAGNQTMKQMPIQSNRDYYDYRKEMNLGPAPARRRLDPLMTAGVVGNMDRNKINHTIMGTGKYQNLYAGVM